MKLNIPIKVVFDDVNNMIDELGKLKKYKLHKDDDMTLVDVDDVVDVLVKYVKVRDAKELPSAQPKKWKWEYRNEKMGDLISREKAINLTWEKPYYTDPLNVLTELRDKLKELPSLEPERKSAYLIDPNPYGKCSNCGHLIDIRDKYNYCPSCGAEMEDK